MRVKTEILYADDDKDDRFFFEMALTELSANVDLVTVEDGEKLLHYLTENSGSLPDILFLDLNMPKKNGAECLSEIKRNERLKDLPVVIYSTSLHRTIADQLYENGAHFYIRKLGYEELVKNLGFMLFLIQEEKLERPSRDKFVLSSTAEY